MSRDSETYRGEDSGCKLATEFLGHQSNCRECPFDRCFHDDRGLKNRLHHQERNARIKAKRIEGLTYKQLSEEFNLSERNIQRVLKS